MIADSSAFFDGERVLSQHQAALTLLQARLSAPGATHLAWLDLACGRGQIIFFLEENLSAEARAKVQYWGYDVRHDYVLETLRTARTLGLGRVESNVGDLGDFSRLLPDDLCFDFITLTNTVHEIAPTKLPSLLIDAVMRLDDSGTLFIYDMERINPSELGAVPWQRDDIRRVVLTMLDGLGASDYRPEVSRWTHHRTTGWTVQIERRHLPVSRDEIIASEAAVVARGEAETIEILERRLTECRLALEALTTLGSQTGEEEEDRGRLLFDYWALSRALERTE